MQFHRSFVFAELGPGKERQAQIDGSGIESVDGLLQLQAEVLVGIKQTGLGDQHLGKVGVDPPVPHAVGVGQGIAGYLSPDTQMIKLRLHRPQTGFDVAQAFPVGQLGEGQAEKLIPAGKTLDLVMSMIPLDAFVEFVNRKKIHQLGKECFAGIHQPPPFAGQRKYGFGENPNSNRKISRCPENPLIS